MRPVFLPQRLNINAFALCSSGSIMTEHKFQVRFIYYEASIFFFFLSFFLFSFFNRFIICLSFLISSFYSFPRFLPISNTLIIYFFFSLFSFYSSLFIFLSFCLSFYLFSLTCIYGSHFSAVIASLLSNNEHFKEHAHRRSLVGRSASIPGQFSEKNKIYSKDE
ncbi:unnamed protein product [Acanthosepion pharaonis]|uniref:Uncharacterized protein n=1 Tax=Acanthosepion pharaonis TaxID=158019 RepID=A0A812BRE6_ACAPH|nr:unnamed protein product [Sepia pharaonis]